MKTQDPNLIRTAIVTGASRGIGRAIAVALGAAGHAVVINYNSNANAARECAGLVEKAGGRSAIVQADVSKRDDHQRIIDMAVEKFGNIHLLVNNAGIAPKVRADLLEAGEASFDELISTNLKGPFFLTQQVVKYMLTRGGGTRMVINVSSISAYTASVNRADYCISKAGIAMMTQLFATRLAELGINIYEVRPGIIATDMTGPVKEKYDRLIFEAGLLPIKRWGQPEDVAKAVVAIAQGALPYSTGEVINVDGGFHIRRL